MKNFHLPLPESTYSHLQARAKHAQVPVTVVAREAIDWWLKEQKKKQQHEELTAYVAEYAGTEFDLDVALEAASVEFLLKSTPPMASKKKSSQRKPR